MKYDPQKIEKKWRKAWENQNLYTTSDSDSGKKNFMLLVEFPYPSGNLHIGHWYTFAVSDILARHMRMQGYNVMYPIGFDAFGLPAENAAIKNSIHPGDWTTKNIEHMTDQLKSMGATLDWDRVVSTIDPEYYRWTQWIFLKLYEKGLAYRAKTQVNWCPKDKTVLANEQVVGGVCERCETPVEQKEFDQWMFKITEFADPLVDDLENLDWTETIKSAQRNWIGRSRGALITFALSGIDGQEDGKHSVEVFTTRPDTIFGATVIVISPEVAQKWLNVGWKASDVVKQYISEALSKRELERLEQKEKTGVDTGIIASNPANGEKLPVWVADYVIGSYGTGAIMAVPFHDDRDREFAEKFDLPIVDAPLQDAQEVITMLQKKGMGESKTQYRLRDWVLSRQRYWGVPIPMIKCADCGYQPVLEEKLPIKLPPLDDFKPTDDGRSPLAKVQGWVETTCPKCGKPAERETDTMDTFVDSSWYFIRYADSKNNKAFADPEKMRQWLPVPFYIGGPEHNTMHLLYSRFITKALHSLGYIDFSEPFLKRRNHGLVLGPNGQRMSKSRGNVIDPDELVNLYGADAVRMQLAFMTPYEQGGPWDPKGINGVHRFLNRVWNLAQTLEDASKSKPSLAIVHRSIKNIGRDISELSFNTGVSELMKLLNHLEDSNVDIPTLKIFLKLLAPFAPHIAEELWETVAEEKYSIHRESWPEYNEALMEEDEITLPVQINGKLRDTITVSATMNEEEVKARALSSDKIQKYIAGQEVKKVIVISKKMVSIVL